MRHSRKRQDDVYMDAIERSREKLRKEMGFGIKEEYETNKKEVEAAKEKAKSVEKNQKILLVKTLRIYKKQQQVWVKDYLTQRTCIKELRADWEYNGKATIKKIYQAKVYDAWYTNE